MRQLKIITGLFLFLFVTVHLVNLAIGFFSLPVAEQLRPILMKPFSNPVGGNLLIGAALLHMLLGIHALYKRNTLQMTHHDSVQLFTALMIPPLMIPHTWVLIANHRMLGFSANYYDLFQQYWITDPLSGFRQVVLVMVLWIHGCIGLFTWLRIKPWWPRVSTFAHPLAVAIPVLALLAFVDGGKRALQEYGLDSSGEYLAPYKPDSASNSYGKNSYTSGDDYSSGDSYGGPGSSYRQGDGATSSKSYSGHSYATEPATDAYGSSYGNRGSSSGSYGQSSAPTEPAADGYGYSADYGAQDLSADQPAKGANNRPPRETDPAVIQSTQAFIELVQWRIIWGYAALLLAVLLARAVRVRGTGNLVEVHYANGDVLKRPVGLNFLEIANINDIPHANLCRGRGRCGTCRIRVIGTENALAPPSEIERATLARTGGGDENVRLACQLTPGPGVISIERLLPPDIQAHHLADLADSGNSPSEPPQTIAEQP